MKFVATVVAGVFLVGASGRPTPIHAAAAPGACFLLYEVGVGEVRRSPATACDTRVTPASTFKVPHALAALDSGAIDGADTTSKYNGAPVAYESWRRDHTLASAMRNSVVWYFQRLAELLGPAREREYLRRFDYGNAPDVTRNVTTFLARRYAHDFARGRASFSSAACMPAISQSAARPWMSCAQS